MTANTTELSNKLERGSPSIYKRVPGDHNRNMRVLIIEDDQHTRDYLAKGLSESGHVVDTAEDGKEGMYLALGGTYDVCIVDRMLPGVDGLSIVKALRASDIPTRILILSALGETDDRITGLRSGGDDYLIKPFSFDELLARLEALTRRSTSMETDATLVVADLELDRLKRTVKRNGKVLTLKPTEFKLLEFMMRNEGQVLTRTMLLEQVWDYHFDPQTNVIDVHVSRLRSKVDKDFDNSLIHTVRGAGYRLSVE